MADPGQRPAGPAPSIAARLPPPIDVEARVEWPRDGVELVRARAVAWAHDAVLCHWPERRLQILGAWMLMGSVRRIVPPATAVGGLRYEARFGADGGTSFARGVLAAETIRATAVALVTRWCGPERRLQILGVWLLVGSARRL